MLKICYLRTSEKGNFHDLTQAWGEGVCRGYQNEEIFKCVPP